MDGEAAERDPDRQTELRRLGQELVDVLDLADALPQEHAAQCS